MWQAHGRCSVNGSCYHNREFSKRDSVLRVYQGERGRAQNEAGLGARQVARTGNLKQGRRLTPACANPGRQAPLPKQASGTVKEPQLEQVLGQPRPHGQPVVHSFYLLNLERESNIDLSFHLFTHC